MPYSAKIFDLNWKRLIRWCLPTVLRKPNTLAFLNAIAVAFNDLHTRFLFFRKDVQYKLKITPQVCFLEKALNDRYDIVERRIVIEDAPEYLPLVLFRRSENKPVKLFRRSEGNPVILYRKSETSQFGVDFVVKVPVAVSFIMDEMKAFVTGYKLATKTFSIQIV